MNGVGRDGLTKAVSSENDEAKQGCRKSVRTSSCASAMKRAIWPWRGGRDTQEERVIERP